MNGMNISFSGIDVYFVDCSPITKLTTIIIPDKFRFKENRNEVCIQCV